jgi:hypothetical protein
VFEKVFPPAAGIRLRRWTRVASGFGLSLDWPRPFVTFRVGCERAGKRSERLRRVTTKSEVTAPPSRFNTVETHARLSGRGANDGAEQFRRSGRQICHADASPSAGGLTTVKVSDPWHALTQVKLPWEICASTILQT